MSLRFVFGRAGMGKTCYISDKITEALISDPAGPPIIMIVPEQSTFQMEQAFLQKEVIKGFTRLHILSFERLSKKILEITGGDNKTYLSDIGKAMILKGLIQERMREGKIELLEKAASKRGFVEKLSGFIRESKMYNVSPDDLRYLCDDENLMKATENNEDRQPDNDKTDTLKKKMAEILLFYEDYEKFIEDNYLHQEDYYYKAIFKMDEFCLLKGSEVYVDGFFGFTPRELMMLEKIMINANYLEISLTVDPLLLTKNLTDENKKRVSSEVDLFYPIIETYNKINKIALDNKINVLQSIELPREGKHRFVAADELYILEKNWDKISPREVFTEKPEKLELIQASNRRAEVEKIARRIIADVRERDMRFREISIIVREFDDYEPIIKSVFSKYEIPYFIDKKEMIHYHPLVELFRSVLEIVISDWSYESVFRYLKTDLIDICRDEVDKLENYVLAHGIRGKEWVKDEPWHYILDTDLENLEGKISKKEEKILEEINKIRDKVVKIIKPVYETLKVGKNKEVFTVREITIKLWELVEELNIHLKLQNLIEINRKSKENIEVQFNTQVWEVLVNLLEELVNYLGDKKMSLNDYLHVLEQGFENISLGLIPPSLDQVVVGSIERSRQHDIKSIYILGMCEGSFPTTFLDSGLFNDRERLILRDRGVLLAPTTKKKLFDEQFWAYVALTRAKDKLVLSYPLAGQDGSTLHPSSLIDTIKRIIPSLEEEYFHEDLIEDDLDILVNPKNVIPIMVQQVQNLINSKENEGGINNCNSVGLSSFWQTVLKVITKDYVEEFRQNPVLQGVYYQNDVTKLSESFFDESYNGVLRSSVSAIENYCACPFMYFAGRMLKLKEREYHRLDPLGFGILYHAVLKLFFERLNEEDLAWKDVTKDQIEEFLTDILKILSGRLKNNILEKSVRNKYVTEKLKEHLNNAIGILAEHEIEDGFSPAYAELGFGKGRKLPPYEIELTNNRKLSLEGKIDRIDEGTINGNKYVRVIDYKGRARPLDLMELYQGINLQLPVYLMVTIRNSLPLWGSENVYPAGMLYFGIKNPIISAITPLPKDEAEKQFRNIMKMDGYILNDDKVFEAMTGGRDDLLKQKFSKNQGRFTSHSRVLNLEEFLLVFEFVEEKLEAVAKEIWQGKFKIIPYKDGTSTPCGFCFYYSVCQFDPRFTANSYRRIGGKGDYLRLMTGFGTKTDKKESEKEGESNNER